MTEDRAIDINEVMRLTGLSRTSVWNLEHLPPEDPRRFPQRSYLTRQSPRWSYLQVQAWLKRQFQGSNEGSNAA